MQRYNLWIKVMVFMGMALVVMGDEFEVDNNIGDLKNRSDSELVTDLVDYILGYSSDSQARTFGHKRIQFMLMPMMFKMGVMSTLLIVLTVISLKGVMIGALLLLLKLSSLFGKFYASISSHHHQAWSPHGQPVHLHVHGNGPHHYPHSGPGPWEQASGPDEEYYHYKG